MKVVPLKDKLLVAENARESKSESGLIIQGSATGNTSTGTVIVIGPNVTEVKVGDVIYLEWSKSTLVNTDEGQRVMIKEEDIIAVVEKVNVCVLH